MYKKGVMHVQSCCFANLKSIAFFPFSLPSASSSQRRVFDSTTRLRFNDADDNENVKKTIGLISKTTTLHVHRTFLYISFPSLHDYDVKVPYFTFCRGREHKTTTCFFLNLNFDRVV